MVILENHHEVNDMSIDIIGKEIKKTKEDNAMKYRLITEKD